MLKAKNPPASVLDGQLFLIRHLLILKEMTRNLDLVGRDIVKSSSDPYGVTGVFCRTPQNAVVKCTVKIR